MKASDFRIWGWCLILITAIGCKTKSPRAEKSNPRPPFDPNAPYGFSKDNPIKIGFPGETEGDFVGILKNGPLAEITFFRHLRDANGRTLEWTREGSVGHGPDGHVVDIFGSKEAGTTKIYIDMYHPEIHPFHTKPPAGFTIWY
jgi:hypothetical protein